MFIKFSICHHWPQNVNQWSTEAKRQKYALHNNLRDTANCPIRFSQKLSHFMLIIFSLRLWQYQDSDFSAAPDFDHSICHHH